MHTGVGYFYFGQLDKIDLCNKDTKTSILNVIRPSEQSDQNERRTPAHREPRQHHYAIMRNQNPNGCYIYQCCS